VAVVAVVLLSVAAADFDAAAHRLGHFSVRLPAGSGQDVWLLIGSDSRAHVPPGAPAAVFGTTADVPGSRADIILLVRRSGRRVTTLSIPRDLLVHAHGRLSRLALTLLDGPQQLIDAVCATLRVAVQHLVLIDFDGFVDLIDALGGVTVAIPRPIRDSHTGLDLESPGRQRLDGVAALALVRSRQAELLIDGAWKPEPDGAVARAVRAAVVLKAARRAAMGRAWNLAAVNRAMWTAADHITTDGATGLSDLALLSLADDTVAGVLPTRALPDSLAVQPTAATLSFLRSKGFGGTCQS
jgi:LCP family protein required for cell wall assembly